MYQALDDIVANGWEFPNTNIVGALDKVMESYYNNDELNSNRYLAILSDGIPTSDGEAEDVEKAQELSSKTWMRVVGASILAIIAVVAILRRKENTKKK